LVVAASHSRKSEFITISLTITVNRSLPIPYRQPAPSPLEPKCRSRAESASTFQLEAMATVHPSRMGLVPQDSREYRNTRYRSRSRGRSQDESTVRRRSPSRDRDSGRDSRRRSPMYDEYKKTSDSAPWRKQENMYPSRGDGGNRYPDRGWGSGDYLTRSVVGKWRNSCSNICYVADSSNERPADLIYGRPLLKVLCTNCA
jgi:hypothetical protein